MQIKRGIAVSPGVAIGPAMLLSTEWFQIPQKKIPPLQREAEAQRLRQGLKEAAEDAIRHQEVVGEKLGPSYTAILGAHVLMIEDPGLTKEAQRLILKEGFTAEQAVSRVLRQYAKMLESIERGQFSTRVADLMDIEKRVLRILCGKRREQIREISEPVVVLAHDLTPSETASLDPKSVFGFATEVGGRTSHTAILAGALHLPAVVGLERFLYDVSAGDTVIVDGNEGLLIVDPDTNTLKRYQQALSSYKHFEHELEELHHLPATTKDDVPIRLLGNIEFPHETKQCAERGADGVGLYRTEFLYLNKKTDPTEEEHLESYQTVLKELNGKSVVIRTLDLGADKFSELVDPDHHERNPVLGLKSIRLCLRHKDLFKTQIRAILRASVNGQVSIMFPMVGTVGEIRECKRIMQEVHEELTNEGIEHRVDIPIGTMIEVPSAALVADLLAKEVDFFSIGTNDLIQYTLAADRTNESVASLYNASDPAVLRLIQSVMKAGTAEQVNINVCGEMSGDPLYVPLLLGLGLRQLSLTPHSIPEVKKTIRSITLSEAERLAQQVMCKQTAQEVTDILREFDRKLRPDFYRS